MDEHGPGWRLRAARARVGLTEQALAGEMRRWADLHGEPRPDITADTVADWEAGVRPLDAATVRLLWLALEVPNGEHSDLAAQLGVDMWSLFRPWRPGGIEDRLRQREFVRYLAELGQPGAVDSEQLDAALHGTTTIDRRLVENLNLHARRLPSQWGRTATRSLRVTVHNHLRTIQVLLDRPMPSPSRREMESAAATTATLAGIIAILIRQHHDAAIYLELGERFAERAGDTEVLVLAMMFTSFLYSAVSPGQLPPDPPRAMAVLEAADRLVSPHTAPIARAWLQLRHAGEYAWCGDERGAFRLLDEAERLGTTAQIPPDGLCSGWTRDTHVAFRGEIATMCGRHDQAIALLESALAALGPNSVATRARALVQLGSAHAEKGDVDHACDLLSRALDLARTAALSERIAWIASVRSRYLACHESEPAVARLDEQLEGGRAG